MYRYIIKHSLINYGTRAKAYLGTRSTTCQKLKDLFIDNDRNSCTITSESSQTFPLRGKRDKTENYGSCEVLQKRWMHVFSFCRN